MKFRFFRFFIEMLILKILKFWKSIFSKMKKKSSGFFLIVLVCSSTPKHAFRALMIPSERCYSAQAHCIFIKLHNSSKFTPNRVDPRSPIIYRIWMLKISNIFFENKISPRKINIFRWFFFIWHLQVQENRPKTVSERFRQFKGKKTQGPKVLVIN